MRLFTTMFEVIKLPLVIVKDAVCAIPDSAALMEPFADTKRQCEIIDREISR